MQELVESEEEEEEEAEAMALLREIPQASLEEVEFPSTTGQGQPSSKLFCDICHAAGKPDHVVKSHSMPWCGSLSTHGRAAIASSMRMAFIDEPEEIYEEDVEDDYESSQDI